MAESERVKRALIGLTGEVFPADIHTGLPPVHVALKVLGNVAAEPIGYSQFNEVLLYCGFDRIIPDYFDYLLTGELPAADQSGGVSAPQLRSVDQFEVASARGQQLGLLAFGNVKFGFKAFGENAALLRQWVEFLTPITTDRFEHRLTAAIPVEEIEVSKRYLLGYLSAGEIKKGLDEKPDDSHWLGLQAEQLRFQEIGRRNQIAYLVSDHLDIYVATSMRERHQFVSVANFCNALFSHALLSKLKLRYFDPTLAYAPDRMDKGLSEALMLKRARVTIYLAQETETLGKDSELASTLAQGKVVIAFVPEADGAYFDGLERELRDAYPATPVSKLLLEQLKYYQPHLAWDDDQVQSWLACSTDKLESIVDAVRKRFRDEVKRYHDKRFKTLQEDHPLGIQVNLRDGVAVGVLVVRSVSQCAELVRGILTNELLYRVEEACRDEKVTHVCLVESISGSRFRVMTRDKALENAFWNFYLQ